jgi:hypothetical protein
VYQEPALAWEFVCAREELEGRTKARRFCRPVLRSMTSCKYPEGKFAKKIQIDLILKNRDNSTKVYKDNMDKIDNHVPEKYTREAKGWRQGSTIAPDEITLLSDDVIVVYGHPAGTVGQYAAELFTPLSGVRGTTPPSCNLSLCRTQHGS